MSPKIWFNNVDQIVMLNIMSKNQQYSLLLLEMLIQVNLKEIPLNLVWMSLNGETKNQNLISIISCTKKTIHSWFGVIKLLMAVVGLCFSLMLIIPMKTMKLMKLLSLQNLNTEDLIKTYKILDFRKELILLNLDSGVLLTTKNMEKNKIDSCIGNHLTQISLKLLGTVIKCK